jgi:hypothetical protein
MRNRVGGGVYEECIRRNVIKSVYDGMVIVTKKLLIMKQSCIPESS